MKDVVCLNGKFITPKDAKVSAFDPGFLYAAGLFETMRSYNDNIVYLDEHIRRLKKSAKIIDLDIPNSDRQLMLLVKKVVDKSGYKDAYVKLIVWKGQDKTNFAVIAKKYLAYPKERYYKGLKGSVSDLRQNEHAPAYRIKSINYLFYHLAYLKAKALGFDEAIIVNTKSQLSEGSRSNLFLVKKAKVYTPQLSSGCLEGITRRVVMDICKRPSIDVNEVRLKLDDLYDADEAFLTNSLMGVMPLVSIDNRRIGRGMPGEITQALMQEYRRLLEARSLKYG